MLVSIVLSLAATFGPLCPEGKVAIASGVIERTGSGSAANQTAACTLAQGDAGTQVFIELARIRDEECVDGSQQGGTELVSDPAVTGDCVCANGDQNQSAACTAAATQAWTCCR
jgi:hypothetical protein